MSVPIPVMTSTIIIESWSRANPRSTDSRPAVSRFQRVFWRNRSSAGKASICLNAYSAVAKESSIAVTAMRWTIFLPNIRCSFQPMTALIAAPTMGNSGMSQRYETWCTASRPIVSAAWPTASIWAFSIVTLA